MIRFALICTVTAIFFTFITCIDNNIEPDSVSMVNHTDNNTDATKNNYFKFPTDVPDEHPSYWGYTGEKYDWIPIDSLVQYLNDSLSDSRSNDTLIDSLFVIPLEDILWSNLLRPYRSNNSFDMGFYDHVKNVFNISFDEHKMFIKINTTNKHLFTKSERGDTIEYILYFKDDPFIFER
jgi:hypothetical protein